MLANLSVEQHPMKTVRIVLAGYGLKPNKLVVLNHRLNSTPLNS